MLLLLLRGCVGVRCCHHAESFLTVLVHRMVIASERMLPIVLGINVLATTNIRVVILS